MRKFFSRLAFSFLIFFQILLCFRLFGLAKSDRRSVIRAEIEAELIPTIEKIVDRIILDVGLKNDNSESQDDKKEDSRVNFQGVDDLSTLNGSVWLNGRRFDEGQIVHPFGLLVTAVNDSALFLSSDGKEWVVVAPTAQPGTAQAAGKHAGATTNQITSSSSQNQSKSLSLSDLL